jgi:hypothetical protein
MEHIFHHHAGESLSGDTAVVIMLWNTKNTSSDAKLVREECMVQFM